MIILRNEFAANTYSLRFSKAVPLVLSELLVSTKWSCLPSSTTGFSLMMYDHKSSAYWVWPFEFKVAYWDPSHNQLERTAASQPQFWSCMILVWFCVLDSASPYTTGYCTRWMWSWRFQEWLPLTSEARPDLICPKRWFSWLFLEATTKPRLLPGTATKSMRRSVLKLTSLVFDCNRWMASNNVAPTFTACKMDKCGHTVVHAGTLFRKHVNSSNEQ